MQTAENSAVGSESVHSTTNPATAAVIPPPAPTAKPLTHTREAGRAAGSGSAGNAPKSSGDGVAAVNNASKSVYVDSDGGKRTDSSGDNANGESDRSERIGYTEKPTPKSTSEAINRATERYRRKIETYEQREKRVAELLKSAGLDGDLETAVTRLQAAAYTPNETAVRSQTAKRDSMLLGDADADEIIKGGEIDAEIKRLEDKPVSQRTRRDRQCYLRLVNERQSRRDLAALGKLGVEVEKLKKDGAFAEFDCNLNPDIPVAERYELFKKYCVMRKAVKPPMSAASRGSTPKREYFDSDTIDGMSREEIASNLDAITRSMKSW